MDFQFWLNPNPAEIERLLPGVGRAGLSGLWILPTAKHFSSTVMESIVKSVRGRRCSLWRIGPDHGECELRAFAKYPGLVDEFLVKSEMVYAEAVKALKYRNTKRCYADVAWLASNQWESLSQFLAESRFGVDGALAFLPADASEAQYWGNVVLGYFWLSMTDAYGGSTAMPLVPTREVLVSILSMGVRIGAIPTSVCTDSDMRRALILWGADEDLKDIQGRLSGKGCAGTDASFQKWCERGIDF